MGNGQQNEEWTGPEIEAEFLPVLLSPGRISFSSISSSVLFHCVFFWALGSIRGAPEKSRLIDFETEKIIYYRISDAFSNIAPAKPAGKETQAIHTSDSGADLDL